MGAWILMSVLWEFDIVTLLLDQQLNDLTIQLSPA